jgi:hypothetical protein
MEWQVQCNIWYCSEMLQIFPPQLKDIDRENTEKLLCSRFICIVLGGVTGSTPCGIQAMPRSTSPSLHLCQSTSPPLGSPSSLTFTF